MGQNGLINPAAPGEITQAGMLVCVSNSYDASYPLATKPDSSALATGFRQAGVLAELPNIECGRDTEPVTTGVYGMVQEVLFKGLSGKISFSMYGTDAGLLALAIGVDPIVTTTAGAVATATGTDAGTGFTSMTVTAAGLTPGKMVQVCPTASKATSTNFARVRSNSGTVVVLDRVLREAPGATDSVSEVTSIEIPLSGAAPKYFSFAGIVDYPDGRVMLVAFPKVYSAKNLSFGIGNGQDAVKLPIELTAMGSLAGGTTPKIGTIKIWP